MLEASPLSTRLMSAWVDFRAVRWRRLFTITPFADSSGRENDSLRIWRDVSTPVPLFAEMLIDFV